MIFIEEVVDEITYHISKVFRRSDYILKDEECSSSCRCGENECERLTLMKYKKNFKELNEIIKLIFIDMNSTFKVDQEGCNALLIIQNYYKDFFIIK